MRWESMMHILRRWLTGQATNNGKDCVGHYVALNKQIFVDILKMAL